MATVRDLIEGSLREIGVLGEGQTATASQAWEAIQRLNRFVERLSLERLTIFRVERTVFTIVASQTTYDVGAITGYKSPPQSGPDTQVYRPIFINDVRFKDTTGDPDFEMPLRKLTDDAYAAISMKDLTSTYPQAWYYNNKYPNGELIFWPIPTSTTLNGVMYVPTSFHGFGSGTPTIAQASTILADDVELPDGWEEMLTTNLAVLLCPSYERAPHPVLMQAAQESLAAIKRANRRDREMSFEPGALIQSGTPRYDIYEN